MSPSSDLAVEGRATVPVGVALHARSAGAFVRAAARFRAAVHVEANGKHANGKSILELLALGATAGTELRLSGSGDGAAEAVAELVELVAELR